MEHLFIRKSTSLCYSCLENLCTRDERKYISLRTPNCPKSKINSSAKDEKIDEINNKVLRLLGASPRSLYVRQNINILKTYRKFSGKKCKFTSATDKFEHFISSKRGNSFSNLKNYNKCDNIGEHKHVFDIITQDRKRFKLHPMRLSNPEWMLSCLENYVQINQ